MAGNTVLSTYLLASKLEDNDVEVNLLAPNDIYIYISRTSQLTSRRCILNIYSTNTLTEYFKHAALYPFFSFKMPFIS